MVNPLNPETPRRAVDAVAGRACARVGNGSLIRSPPSDIDKVFHTLTELLRAPWSRMTEAVKLGLALHAIMNCMHLETRYDRSRLY
jgi:hypothetical protein